MSFDRFGGLLGEFVFCHGLTGANEASALSVLLGNLTLFPEQERRGVHSLSLMVRVLRARHELGGVLTKKARWVVNHLMLRGFSKRR